VNTFLKREIPLQSVEPEIGQYIDIFESNFNYINPIRSENYGNQKELHI
jgi:hypothetical protein